MPEIKVKLDDMTFKVAQKITKIWGRMDFEKSPLGASFSLTSDIWHTGAGLCGLLRTMLIAHPDWKWPLWIREQNRPDSPGFIIPLAGNTANRNYRTYSMVGTVDHRHEPIIGMDGTVMPRKDAYSLAFWLYHDGKLLAIGEGGKIKQERVSGYLPIITTAWKLPQAELQLNTFADVVAGQAVCFTKVLLKNLAGVQKKFTLFAVVTPWGPDDFHPVTGISYDKGLSSFLVQGKLGVVLENKPDSYSCMNFEEGDVCVDAFDGKLAMKADSRCEVGYCTAAASFDLTLKPFEEKFITVKQLIDEVAPSDKLVEAVKKAEIKGHFSRVAGYWKNLIGKGIEIKVPDKLVVDTYKSILTDLHLLKDGENITPGPACYHGDWIRDHAHMLFGLELAGFHQSAHECMDYYKRAQRQDGYFWHSTDYWLAKEQTIVEYDSAGEAIWSMVQHYRFAKDRDWLKCFYPNIKKGAQFLKKIRKETITAGKEKPLHYGLIPKSWSAEHTGPLNYIYYDDFWAICGLNNAAYAARELGYKKDAEWMTEECQDLKKCVWDSIKRVIQTRDLECFPASPYQDISSTIIGNIACLWPCKITDPYDKLLGKVLDVLYTRFMPNGCLFHNMAGTYWPIFTWSVANCFLQRRENEKAIRIFRWTLKNMQSPTHTQPEGVHPLTFRGGEGDGISLWAGVECFMLIRNMLLLEQDDVLWITPCIPGEWLADGEVIEVSRAPTFYGELNYRIESKIAHNSISMELNLKGEGPRKGYIYYINHPAGKKIRSVSVDGNEWKNFEGEKVRLLNGTKKVEVCF